MADIDRAQDTNTGTGNDAASTLLVSDWLGTVPKHNPASDAGTSPKPAGAKADVKSVVVAAKKSGDSGDVATKPTDAAEQKSHSSNTNLDSERNKLKAQAEQSIKDPQERASFEANMTKFEQRAASNNPPISVDEVAGTYKEVGRLLTAQDNSDSPLHADDRRKIAEQIISQAADPATINPSPDTCGASAVEKVMYTRYPAEASKVVVDVATTGQYTTPDGKTSASIDKESIIAHDDGSAAVGIGKRSQASQIFQITADNVLLHKLNPDGNFKFEQKEPNKNNNTGEVLVETGLFSNKTVSSGFGAGAMFSNDVAEMAGLLSGKNDISVIRNKDMPDFQDLGDKGENLLKQHYGDNLSQEFETESQLKDMLSQAQRNGKMPVIMTVNAADGLAGVTEQTSAGHALTVLNYDEKTGKVLIDTNGIGTKEIGIDALYQGSMQYKTFLEQEIKQDHEAGIFDTTKELKLLEVRTFNAATPLSDEDFNKQYEQILEHASQAWTQQKQDGAFDQSEHDRVAKMALDLVTTHYGNLGDPADYIDATKSLEILKTQHNAGLISDTDYTQLVYDNVSFATNDIRQSRASGDQEGADQTLRDLKAVLNPAQQAYLDKLLQEPQ